MSEQLGTVETLYRGRSLTELQWLGVGGKSRVFQGDLFFLGWAVPRGLPVTGFRRAWWDFCFGYVSGFPLRDIFYYIATRSFSSRERFSEGEFDD
jgi:hypothetical protein